MCLLNNIQCILKSYPSFIFYFVGTVSVFFIIGLVMYWASIWGVNVDLNDAESPEYVPMFESNFPSLSGMLALGLFIHNAIITITSNHAKPEKNVSDLFKFFNVHLRI